MELNISELEAMSIDEIGRKIDELEKEAGIADTALVTVENKDTELSLQALDIQRQRKELKQVIDKAKFNCRTVARHLSAARRIFWRVKN